MQLLCREDDAGFGWDSLAAAESSKATNGDIPPTAIVVPSRSDLLTTAAKVGTTEDVQFAESVRDDWG